jgi:hypothetical protein
VVTGIEAWSGSLLQEKCSWGAETWPGVQAVVPLLRTVTLKRTGLAELPLSP